MFDDHNIFSNNIHDAAAKLKQIQENKNLLEGMKKASKGTWEDRWQELLRQEFRAQQNVGAGNEENVRLLTIGDTPKRQFVKDVVKKARKKAAAEPALHEENLHSIIFSGDENIVQSALDRVKRRKKKKQTTIKALSSALERITSHGKKEEKLDIEESNNMNHITNYYKNLCEQLEEKAIILETKLKQALRSEDPATIRKALLRQAWRQAEPQQERRSENERIESLIKDYELEDVDELKDIAKGYQARQRKGHTSPGSDTLGWNAYEALSLRNRARDASQRFNKNINQLATALHGLRGLEAPPSEIEYRPEYMGKQTEADRAIISAIRTATEGLKRGQYASSKERSDVPRSALRIRMRKNK